MRTVKFTIVALLLAAMACFPQLLAFERPKLPLAEKVARASLVVIGAIKDANYPDQQRAGNERVALVRVDQTLKGEPVGDIRVVYRNGIAELALDCCEQGGRYLFFLTEDKRGLFQSVSGADGVYRVDSTATDRH